jgi:hypothetical protein
MELHEQEIPIAVTLVKPASIDTPFFDKARAYLTTEPQPVPPVYAPEVVSDVIIEAAQWPVRELIAGGAGVKLSAARFAPGLADRYMQRWTFDSQSSRVPASHRRDNLYAPVAHDGGERSSRWAGHTRESSLYTTSMLHPAMAAVALAASAVTAALLSQIWRWKHVNHSRSVSDLQSGTREVASHAFLT